ncbi:hypothetical protein ACFL4E_03625, partial [Candidatus Omnitrophota bacterium]
MKKYMMFIAIFIGLLLLASSSYCEGLTEKECKIYYDYKEADQAITDAPLTAMNTQIDDVLEKYNLTTNEIEDIVSQGEAQKLTKKQLEIYAEYKKKEKPITKKYKSLSDKKNVEVGAQYGLTAKEVNKAIDAFYYYKYAHKENLAPEEQREYEEVKEVGEAYNKRLDA